MKDLSLTLIITVLLLFNSARSLKDYCVQVNRNSILNKFSKCVHYLPAEYEPVERQLVDILAAIDSSDSKKEDTIRLFLQMLEMTQLMNGQMKFEECFSKQTCELFKGCEFPLEMEGSKMEQSEASAARLAAILTAFSINEEKEKNTLLSPVNLRTNLKISLLNEENIYDGRIIFKSIPGKQEYSELHGTKAHDTSEVTISVTDTTEQNIKNLKWYNTWKITDSPIISIPVDTYPFIRQLKNLKYKSGITYNCERSVWHQIVSVPFLFADGRIRGVVATSISLRHFDLDQCGSELNTTSKQLGPFVGTDKCDKATTTCLNQVGGGFVLNSYVCECQTGFFATNLTMNNTHRLTCAACEPGCDSCVDASPCRIEIDEKLKQICLIVNLVFILICIVLIGIVSYYMSRKMLKTSSPEMLIMVLVGAILSYCELIPLYFTPSYWTCTAAQVLQLEGFLLAYGALVLKTWRECKLFYVRSVKTIKITNHSLMKRLALIMLVGTVYLIFWALRPNDSPSPIELRDVDNLKYLSCTITEWNYISMLIQIAVLSYGVVQAIYVRRASIAFKETKLITWAIFNECFFKIVVASLTIFVFQNEKVKVYVYFPFLHTFLRIHLTISIMILLIFTYKIYTIAVARKKPYQSNQSALLNNFNTIAEADGEAKNSSVCDEKETEKEKELKIEIQRLCRQLEETRSLSMRIANPHLLTKKSRFINKAKTKYLLPLPLDVVDKPPKAASETLVDTKKMSIEEDADKHKA